MIERLIIAAPEGWQSPRARYRLGPIARAGLWRVDALATGTYPGVEQVASLIELGGTDATLVLQRVMPCRSDIERLRRFYRHLVFDIDDAIYAVPPELASSRLKQRAKQAIRLFVRGSPNASSRKRPLERPLAQVDARVVGNSILAEFARRRAARVIETPTTVEPEQQPPVVASKEEALIAYVPDCKSEDAVQAREHVGPVQREHSQQHLGVVPVRNRSPCAPSSRRSSLKL